MGINFGHIDPDKYDMYRDEHRQKNETYVNVLCNLLNKKGCSDYVGIDKSTMDDLSGVYSVKCKQKGKVDIDDCIACLALKRTTPEEDDKNLEKELKEE